GEARDRNRDFLHRRHLLAGPRGARTRSADGDRHQGPGRHTGAGHRPPAAIRPRPPLASGPQPERAAPPDRRRRGALPVKVEMQLQGVDGVLDMLRKLPAEVVSKRGGPVKLALAKGARFLRDRAKENLRRQIALNGDESTGLLEKSVIASRGKPPLSGKGERYLVRVKRKAYDGQKLTKRDTRVAPKSRKRVT